MSFKNDSHKSETNTKSLGNIKNSGSTKSSGNTKGGKNTKSAQSTKSSGQSFQANDIKSLVNKHGRANLAGQEWALKAPSWNDSALQAIISDPKFTVKPAGKAAADGKLTYELRGHGKTINVTIGHQECND